MTRDQGPVSLSSQCVACACLAQNLSQGCCWPLVSRASCLVWPKTLRTIKSQQTLLICLPKLWGLLLPGCASFYLREVIYQVLVLFYAVLYWRHRVLWYSFNLTRLSHRHGTVIWSCLCVKWRICRVKKNPTFRWAGNLEQLVALAKRDWEICVSEAWNITKNASGFLPDHFSQCKNHTS